MIAAGVDNRGQSGAGENGAARNDDPAGFESGAPKPAAPAPDKAGVLGHAVWLMTQSPQHRHLLLSDLEWMLIPPVALGQFRLWREGTIPSGFATWAYLNEEVEARLKAGPLRLAPAEWKCGDRLTLMMLLTPFGGAEAAMKDLKEVLFAGRTLHTARTF